MKDKFITALIPWAMVASFIVAAWLVLVVVRNAVLRAQNNQDNVDNERSLVSGDISDSIAAPSGLSSGFFCFQG